MNSKPVRNFTTNLVAFFATCFLTHIATSAPLTQAELTRVYRQVSMVDPAAGKRPAVVHDVVKGELGVETGVDSRAELLFPDNTLTRLAANTFFSFKTGTREMDLSHGAILFQIPKGVGGAKINTAAITAAITGTTGFVERVGDTFKLVLLEGTVRVYFRDRMRESMLVHGGQMLIAPTKSHSMKDWSTVDFDVAKVMKTSTLLKPDLFDPLPPAAQKLIAEVVEKQDGQLSNGELNPTNLVIAGGLSTITLVDNSTRNRAEAADPKRAKPTPPGGGGSNTPTPTPSATAVPTATPTAAPTATPTATPTAAPTATPTAAPTATPTAAPTATPTASPSPTASSTPSGSPSPSATVTAASTPNAAPTPNLNPAPTQQPPVITSTAPYVIKGSTVIDVSKASPSITTDGTTDSGLFFVNVAKSGSPSRFLFGTTSLFDNRMNFDNQYASAFGNSGVYKFTGLELEGDPTFITREGANKVALISQSNITSSPLGGTVNLNGIDSLFVGTVNGSISLSDRFTFTNVDGSAFKLIQLYARNGTVNFGSDMDLKGGKLNLAAEQDINIMSTASIKGDSAILNALGNATIDGSINTHFGQIYAGSNLVVNGTVKSDNFYGYGNTGTINGSLSGRNVNLQIGGDLNLTSAGSLSSKDKLTIVTGGAMNLAGATEDLADATSTSKTYNLTAGTDINISGTLKASDTLNATGRTANITNAVSGKTIGFTMTNGFNMSGPMAAINSNDLTVSTGGGINLTAVNNNNNMTLTAGTNAQLANGTIAFNGPITTKNLNATGTALTVNKAISGQKLTFNASEDFLSNTGGDITDIDGDNALTINAAGRLTLNGKVNGYNVLLNSGTDTRLPGALTINGNVRSQSNLTVAGPSEIVNAIVTAKDATFNSGTDFRLNGNGALNLSGNGTITASNSILLDGNTSVAGFLNLNGAADMTANGKILAQDITVEGTNDTFNNAIAAKHFTVNNQGDFLLTNNGSLTATDVVAINTRNGIIMNGAASGKSFSFSAGRDLTLNAAVQTPGSVTTNVKNAFVNNSVNADTVNFTVGNDFDLGQPGSLTTVHDITVTSNNRNITLGGSTDSNKLNLNALKGTVALNGDADAQLISVSAKGASIAGQLDSGSDMNFTLTQDFNLNGGASLTAIGNYNISGQSLTFDGSSSGNVYKLTAGRGLTVNGAITAGDFQADADDAIFNSNLTSAKGIALDLTGDFVTGAGSHLSAMNNVGVTALGSAILSGALNSTNLNVAAQDIVVSSSANLQSLNSLNLSGTTASIYGRLVAPTVNVTGTNSLLLDSATGYISADAITLNSSSGTLFLASASNNTGGLDAARLQTLRASGATIKVVNDFALAPNGLSTLTAGQGGIDATGHDLSGFSIITLNSGSYTGDSLSADTVVFNNRGDLTLTGDLNVNDKLTTPGAISVDGVLGGKTISATKTIDAGTVAAADVTAGTVLTIGDGGIISTVTREDQKITAPNISWGDGGINLDGVGGTGSSAPGNASNLTLTTSSATFDINGNVIKYASLTGGDADPTRNDAGGSGGTLNVNATGVITVNNPIMATTGLNSRSGMTGGNGGTVNLTSNSTITVNSKIETSSNDGNRRVSAKGGKIKLDSKATNGTAIQIGNTANLQALLNAAAPGPGGVVTFKSAGGAVNVSGNVTADRGTVDIRNTGNTGKVNLTNSTLSADVVKAGALGDSGTLTIGGGTINANTMLKLYAGGANGLINFIADVSLNGSSTKIISANTVTIQPTVVVTIGGPNAAQVYTNHPNYTGYGGVGKGYGTFAGAGAVTIKPSAGNQPPGF